MATLWMEQSGALLVLEKSTDLERWTETIRGWDKIGADVEIYGMPRAFSRALVS